LLFKLVLGIALSLTMAVFAKSAAAAPWQAQPLAPSESESESRVAAREMSFATTARNAPRVNIAPGAAFGYLPLDAFGMSPTPIGDEELINHDTPPFVYNGATHTRIGVSSNGYLVIGGASGEDSSFTPILGSGDRPNGVLAPFWTDLDGTGAPGIYATILTDGVSDWIVVEWRLNVFGTTSRRTFQVWIGANGTEDITFAYDPANLPASPFGLPFAVGAENLDGTHASSIDGTPAGDLRVTSVPYTNAAPTAADDAFATDEDTPLTENVLANDSDEDGDDLSASLAGGPEHGTVDLDADGSFTYTPAANYNGADSFTYEISDGQGESASATVALTVAAVNDAPTVTVGPGGACGRLDLSGTVNLAVADVDNDAASLTLSAASGNKTLVPSAGLKISGRTLRVITVPLRTGTAVVTVTVSDGTATGTVPVTVHAAGIRANKLTGTEGADLLLGQFGADRIDGLAGNDVLCGGWGRDTLTGGPGADHFEGGEATDFTPADGDTKRSRS
jgi:VCBS repeat-containing protein